MRNDLLYLADSSVILASIRPPDLRAGEEPFFAEAQRRAREVLSKSAVSTVHVAEVLDVLVKRQGHTPQSAIAAFEALGLTELPVDRNVARLVATVRKADENKLLSFCDLLGMAHAKAADLQAATGDLDWQIVWASLPIGWMQAPLSFKVMARQKRTTKS